MKVVKLINKEKTYIDKSGNERNSFSFYIELDDGKLVAIKNSFKSGFYKLNEVAEEREKTK